MFKDRINSNIYLRAAFKYKPKKIKILFIAESPPHKDEDGILRYFYFETLFSKDDLFRSITEVILPKEYNNLEKGFLGKKIYYQN